MLPGSRKKKTPKARKYVDDFSTSVKTRQGSSKNLYCARRKSRWFKTDDTEYVVRRLKKPLLPSAQHRRLNALALEASLLGDLDHPNVVGLHHLFEKDTRWFYLVLKSVPGAVELFDRISQKSAYSELEARNICAEMVDAVAHIHSKGIVHRNLKPESILVPSENGESAEDVDATVTTTTTTDKDGTVTTTTVTRRMSCRRASGYLKITDFDLARRVTKDKLVPATSTKSEFAAPEVILGQDHGKPVDMWSLGCLVYILLTGRHPFLRKTLSDSLLQAASGLYSFPEEYNVTEDAKDFVQKLLTVDSTRRMTAEEAKHHPWLKAEARVLEGVDLLEPFKVGNAKRKLRVMLFTSMAARRMAAVANKPKKFLESFELGNVLGQGAFGTVYEATPKHGSNGLGSASNEASRVAYAVKKIRKSAGMKERAKQEVRDEAEIMKRLRHENVLRMVAFFEVDPEAFYLVLDRMHGGELLHRIERKEFYNEAEARKLCVVLLHAVKYIHSRGIVHRDLKPDNLLLASERDDTSIRVADFGLASRVPEEKLTTQCGTPAYIAPEVLCASPYDTRADMWSVGVIIYVLLAGYHPFRDIDQRKMFRAIKKGHYTFHEVYWSGVSREAQDLISSLLTVDPMKRLTASQACQHKWLSADEGNLRTHDLSEGKKKLQVYNAKEKVREAIISVMAANNFMNGMMISRNRACGWR